MKRALFFVGVCLSLTAAQGQTIPQPPDPEGPTILIRGQLPPPDLYMNEGLEDYGNLFANFSGIYDSSLPYATLTPNGAVVEDFGGWGGQVGAGFNLYRRLEYGLFYASYSASYDRFNRNEFKNGTNQTLRAAYSKQLSHRWSIRVNESFVFSDDLGSTYSIVPNASLFPSVQPYSQRAFYDDTSITLGYQATHRLSYFVGGDLFASIYQPSQITGYVGPSGTAGASYRFTLRTTLTASYTASRLNYTNSGIVSDIQSGALTLSHSLTRRIQVGLSAGVSAVHSSGTSTIFYQGIPASYYAQGYFQEHTISPNYTASLYRTGLRSRFGVTGGEGISGGNGLYLTSRNAFVNAQLNYQLNPRLSVSGQFGYSRLTSVSGAVTGAYGAWTYSLAGGYQISRHTFVNASYSGWRYPQYATIDNFNTRRLTFGVTFATKDFPLPY
ncbi:MAG: hypothetical protein WAM39_24235 [Bryobacteraceae bacterium]